MATKKQIIYPLILLAVGGGGYSGLAAMKKPPEKKEIEPNIPVVAVEPVTMSPLLLRVDSQGVVAARYETRLVAQVSGEIVELSDEFVRGGFVKKGQLLARIDPNDYEAALIEAQANLAQAMAALEQEQAQGRVAEEEWKGISSTKPSALGLRRPQLKQEQARVKAAEAAVKRAKRNLERTEIVAPYDALIGSRNIGMGSFATVGSELGKLMNTAVADVRLPVSAKEMQYLKDGGVGADVELIGSVSGHDVSWHASIVRSEGVIDTKSRMTYLVAEIARPYQQQDDKEPLRFGTYVSAKINGISLPNATLVSRHLINKGKVPTLDSQNKLHFKTIDVVREQARDAVVTDGLNSGDKVIVSALDYPVEGMQLKLKSELEAEQTGKGSEMAMNKE